MIDPMEIVTSLPLPSPNLHRMIWQPVTEAGEDAPMMRLAPLEWQSSYCHHALEHLAQANDRAMAQIQIQQAEIDRLREALIACRDELDAYSRQEYPYDNPTHARYRQRDYDANPARAALQEVKA